MKNPIFCSDTEMRFYLDDGWTKLELDDLCIVGEVFCPFPQDLCPFFKLDTTKGSHFDVLRLLDRAQVVHRGFNKMFHLTDLQYLELLNCPTP